MTPILYIANKNYSSWSMRAWLTLTWGGIAFEERIVPLLGDGVGKAMVPEVLAVNGTGRLPILYLSANGSDRIWDSLAICEWAAEKNPSLWPRDPHARAVARSASAEIHGGIPELRRDMHFNLRRRTTKGELADDVKRRVTRIITLWTEVRGRFGASGPYLFGERSVADAMYTPLCARFRTYGLELSGVAKAYSDTMLADPAFRAWEKAAEIETWTMPHADHL